MAESLRDLVVSLSLNSDNCSANLRSINQQMKEADSQFKLAASGVANFENTTAGAQAQLQALQQKFQLQQQAVQQYERALEAAKGKLETSVQAHEKLAARLETAKQRHADLGQQVDKLTADLQEAEAAGLKGTDGRTNSDNTGRAARYMTQGPCPFSLFLDVAIPAVTQYNKGRAFEAVMPHGTKTGPPGKGSCLRGICGFGDSMWFQSTEAVPGVGQRTASEAMDITETGIQSITIRHELATPGATQMLIMDKY